MTSPHDIRRLGPDDLPLMRSMNALFGAAFEEPKTYGDAPPSEAYLTELLGKAHVIALACVEAGTVVGGLVAYELDKFEQERREVYIYDLAVAENRRRRGIAETLIGKLAEVARARGAWVVYVQADHGDEPAIALYEKLGVREDVLHFDIAVGRD